MTGNRGRFLVFEGLDGAGTTTQTALLVERLAVLGRPAHATHEPSTGEIGLAVRRAIQGTLPLGPEALALGFAADRLHHLADIDRVLAAGTHVVCDRYALSSLAYQAADGVDVAWLAEINREARPPDATIFVDTPIAVCLERITARGDATEDRFHTEDLLRATDSAYRRALASGFDVGALVTVDGALPVDVVAERIWEQVAVVLGLAA